MTRDAEHTPSPQSVVVPVEPTREMIDAGWNDAIQSPESIYRAISLRIAGEVLAALSPEAPAREASNAIASIIAERTRQVDAATKVEGC
ncbi:hypothetical protein D3C72_2216530 [compost metagenome]